jgi:hypothetical protein
MEAKQSERLTLISNTMITTQNYFDRVKTINVSALPSALKEGHHFTKEITENHKTWTYYKSDKDIKSTIDEYLANLSAHLNKENKPKSVKSTKYITEEQAREAAKSMIKPYVLRGDTLESIKSGRMGSYSDEFNASILGNKIEVTAVNGKTTDWKFTLQSIYNEIKEENGMNTKKQAVQHSPTAKKPKPVQQKTAPMKKAPSTNVPKRTDPNEVERIIEEVKFIKRFVLLQNKQKTKQQVLNFINQLQKAIVEKRIRKVSPYAKYIDFVQDNLIKFYDSMAKTGTMQMTDKILDKLIEVAGSEKVRLSVGYMKRYIGIHGKQITKEKAKTLHNLIVDAIQKGKIKKNDPYIKTINEILASLKHFYEVAKRNDTLEVHEAVLNGLEGTLAGLGCIECDEKKKRRKKRSQNLSGIDQELAPTQTENTVMNSMDFSKLKFDTIGFMGKWKALIGDPSEGFTAMVFGKPKTGKSYLCVDWAGYLARNHGKTLYVAKEEKLDATLQLKLNDKNVKHPDLFVSDYLPDDLNPYQYIFLDSVNRLGLTPEDLNLLKEEYPDKSFIYIFQTTKEGNFRGANVFQHDVDVVIEVPEKGKAVQFGRFNQGGEMEIFD